MRLHVASNGPLSGRAGARALSLAVRCARCGAGPGHLCVGTRGRERVAPHYARFRLGQRLKVAMLEGAADA